MTTTRTIEQIQDALAAGNGECPEYYVRACATDGPVADCAKNCRGGCAGTGRVYVLEGVREPCGTAWHLENLQGTPGYKPPTPHKPLGPCRICHGKGWVASRDDMLWLEASLQYVLSIDRDGYILFDGEGCALVCGIGWPEDRMYATAPTARESLYRALEKALLKEKP